MGHATSSKEVLRVHNNDDVTMTSSGQQDNIRRTPGYCRLSRLKILSVYGQHVLTLLAYVSPDLCVVFVSWTLKIVYKLHSELVKWLDKKNPSRF